MMYAKVVLYELIVPTLIGVYPYEREKMQELLVDVEMQVDIEKAVASDTLTEETVDYEQIAKSLCGFAKTARFHLIESFAYHALDLLFSLYPLRHALIRVKKKIPGTTWAMVELQR